MTARISLLLVLALAVALPSFGGSQVYVASAGRAKGWLGVETQDVTGRLRDRKQLAVDAGAYVNSVVEESPAEKAGIQEGDVITGVDGKTIADAGDLVRAIQKIKPETDVKIEIDRKGDKKTLTATLERARAQEFSFRFDGGREHRIVIPPMPKMPDIPRLHRGFRVWVDQESFGLELQELTKQLAEYFQVPSGHGLLVSSVVKGSSAEQAGFRAGDVIVKLDGETIRDMDDFHDLVRESRSGKEVPCDVIRKGKTESLKWKLERADGGGEDDDDYSLRGSACAPSVSQGACDVHRTAARKLQSRLEAFGQLVVERVIWLKSVISDRLAAFWRPIGQKFS